MIELFIIFGSILAILSSIYGLANYQPWLIIIGAILFIVISLGLFTSGYQTYSNAQVNIQQTATSPSAYEITVQPTTYNPNINGTPEEQIIYAWSILTLVAGLFLVIKAMQERNANAQARRSQY